MSTLPLKTKDEIFNDLVSYAVAEGCPVTDFSTGTILGEAFRAISWKISQMYSDGRIAWENTLDQFIYTAFKFTRKTGTNAVGTVQFVTAIPAVGDIVIPIGTVVSTVDNKQFSTTDVAIVENGETTSNLVLVSSNLVGDTNNVDAGTITKLVSVVTGISGVSNPSPTASGTSKESNVEFAVRFAEYVSNLVKSNINGLQNSAKSVEGVKYSKVVEDLGLFATGEVTFATDTAPVGGITIPAKTRVKTIAEVFFQTVEELVIAEGETEGTVEVRARDRGLFGNVDATKIKVIVDDVTGVNTVTNASATTGGNDGILGRIFLYVDDGSGSVSTSVMTDVQVLIEGDETENNPGSRPAGIVIIYDTPEVVPINITQTIYYDEGVNITDLQNAIETAQANYINSLAMGETVVKEKIDCFGLRNNGVKDINMGFPTGNTSVGGSQTAKIGIITTTMELWSD